MTTLGRYELLAKIGHAGGAEIHLGRQRGAAGFEKLVVVRVMDGQKGLLDEARRASQIKHPNVVDIYDVGEADGRYYVTTDALEGESLRSVIDLGAGGNGKRIDELDAARVIAEVAEALDSAHDLRAATGETAGFAHGHVTAASIVVQYDGQVKLADFGVRPERVVVSSPDRIGAVADRKTDYYALGVVMWEALTGEPLFVGTDDEIRAAIKKLDVVPKASELNANVPALFDDILAKALAKDPAIRYATGKEMANDIEDVLSEARYSRRNDRIAAYMASAFAARIEKRREVMQQIVNGTTPDASAIEAAFGIGRPSQPPRRAKPTTKQPPITTPASMAATEPVAPVSPSPSPPPPAPSPSPSPPPVTLSEVGSRSEPTESKRPTPSSPPPVTLSEVGSRSEPTESKRPSPSSPPPVTLSEVGSRSEPTESKRPTAPEERPASTTAPMPAIIVPPAAPPAPSAPSVGAITVMGVPAAPDAPPPAPVEPPMPKPGSMTVMGVPAAPTGTPKPAPSQAETIELAAVPSIDPRSIPALTAAPAVDPSAATPPLDGDGALPAVPPGADPLPNPADAISLPRVSDSGTIKRTDETDVLSRWAYQTGSEQAIYDDEDDPNRAKKILLYAIGGGIAVAAIITVIALAMGGGKQDDDGRPPDVVAAAEIDAEAAMPPPPPEADAAEMVAAIVAVADAEPIDEPADAEHVAVVEPPDAEPPLPDARTAVVTAPPDAAPKITKKDPPKKDPPKKDPPKKKPPKTKQPAGPIDPYADVPQKPKKADARELHRAGLQQYARGNLSNALQLLRAAASEEPGFAATWRGLGLVYEKLNNKGQARAAYKRYLKLSPNASDADQIKDRLAKL